MNTYINDKLKYIICSLLFYTGYFNYKLSRQQDKAMILMYHRINNNGYEIGIHKKNFEKQMEYIRKKMNPVPLLDITEWISKGKLIPPGAVAVSFDDGYEDNFLNAYPILRRFDIPSTIFLTTGHIGSRKIFWWDRVSEIIRKTKKGIIDLRDFQRFAESPIDAFGILRLNTWQKRVYAYKVIARFFQTLQIKKIPEATDLLQEILEVEDSDIEAPSMLNWQQIKEMSNNGIEFGAHTVNHPALTKINIEESRMEICESKRAIEARLNKPVYGFAYPYGLKEHFNEQIKKIVKNSGFYYSCSAETGVINVDNNIHELKRISMPDASISVSVRAIYKNSKVFS